MGRWIVVAAVLLSSGCNHGAQAPTSELVRTATIKDIMDAMVDPSGDVLFESVAQISDEQGVRERAPQTDEDWADVRRHAVILLEAPNLLVMEGRKVALSHEKAQNPEVELQPEQIQKMIDDDRPSFIRRAKRLQEAAQSALTAINARDTKALFGAIEKVDKACENCHLHYWYPNDKRAVEAARESGGID